MFKDNKKWGIIQRQSSDYFFVIVLNTKLCHFLHKIWHFFRLLFPMPETEAQQGSRAPWGDTSTVSRFDSRFLLPQVHKVFAKQGIFTHNKSGADYPSISGKRFAQAYPSAGRTNTYISPHALIYWSVGGKKDLDQGPYCRQNTPSS